MEAESKDEFENEGPLLILGDSEPKPSLLVTDESKTPLDRTVSSYPFKRWMDSFRVKRSYPPSLSERFVEGWSEPSYIDCTNNNSLSPYHALQEQQWERLSGHSSQLGTVKTTTLSAASQSVARSRGHTQSTTNQSSSSDPRMSIDSLRPSTSPAMDEDAQKRAFRRRQILQELVTTESDYVLGLKALSEVLSIFSPIRPDIYNNIQRLREIHGNFLMHLQNVTPASSDLMGADLSNAATYGLHRRLGAMDIPGIKSLQNKSLRTRSFKASVQARTKTLAAEPYEALEVAREIGNLSTLFTAYEEFSNKYDLLSQDLDILRGSIPSWAMFDKGVEALSKSVASMDRRKQDGNKSMALHDLLIKPVQRLCKYQLFVDELQKCTSVSDCPSAHEEITEILENIRTSVSRTNCAVNGPAVKDRIGKTVLLQQKLEFCKLSPVQDVYMELGPLNLCGALFAVYETPIEVRGEYMVCVLFNSHLLLARTDEDHRRLHAVACLYVCDMKIGAPDSGRGLCCRGALFSWKISFGDKKDNFELFLSASSATEEKQWKTEIIKSAAALSSAGQTVPSEPRKFSFSSLNLVPLDCVPAGVPCLTRRSSLVSLPVSRLSPDFQEVYIKNTACASNIEEAGLQTDGERIGRTKSVRSRRCPLVLSPRKQERGRLEKFIADVYTRDVLPYPGMVPVKGGDIMSRTSSLMRRFSFHRGFNRRSGSPTSTYAGSTVADSASIEEEYKDEILDNIRRAVPVELHSEKETVTELPRETVGRSKTLRLKNLYKRTSTSDLLAKSAHNKDSEFTSTDNKRSLLRTALVPRNLRRPGLKMN